MKRNCQYPSEWTCSELSYCDDNCGVEKNQKVADANAAGDHKQLLVRQPLVASVVAIVS